MVAVRTLTKRILDDAGENFTGTLYLRQPEPENPSTGTRTHWPGRVAVRDGEFVYGELELDATLHAQFVEVALVADVIGVTPITWWTHIPAVPAIEFADLPVDSLPAGDGRGRMPGSAYPSHTLVGKSEFLIDIRDFGALMDGSSDDTAAWNEAIDYANAKQPTPVDANDVKGVTIFVPAGRTVISAALHPITRSGVNVVGISENASVIIMTGDEVTFTWGTVASQLVVGGGMANLKLERFTTPSGAAAAVTVSYGTRLNFGNILLANVGTFLLLGTSASMFASAIWLSNVGGYMHNTGGSLIVAQYGAGLIIENCKFFVGGVLPPAVDRTSTMTSLPGTNGIELGAGSWDTVQITGSFFERFYRGISVVTDNGVIVNNVFISNTFFDYIRQDCIWLEANGTSSGGICGMNISNSWFASWEGDGISFNGAGLLRGFSVDNCRMVSAGAHSIYISGGTREVTIRGSNINGSNRRDVRAAAVAIYGGSHINVENNIIGYDSSWGGFAWQPHAGVSIAADLDFVHVSGNDVSGASMNFDLRSNTRGSINRVVRDNLGADYAGHHEIAAPPSGEATTNMTAHEWAVHVYGGTVSAIEKNGTKIAGMTAGQLIISPGESFTLTYAAAPALTVFFKA